ncbi:MAG: alcohol dehydrogenase catalytic domain-containing protein [Sphaerochaeta sp.]
MKYTSAWVDKPKHISLMRKELRALEADEVLVRIKACGVCGTDLHFFNDFPSKEVTPLGHEAAGYVETVGSGVSDLLKGAHVVVQNNIACNSCPACLNQKPYLCSNIQTYMDDQAGMGEYLIVPRAMVIPFEGLSFVEATLAEPITVALDLCKEADIQLFENVLIMGPGVIGLSCIVLSRLRGASKIVVVGHHLDSIRGKYREKVAYQLGADLVVDSANPNWKKELKEQFPDLFDRVIVTSPPKTIPDGIDMAGFHGQIVFNGIDFSDDRVTFNANDFHFAKKRLIASHAIPNWGFPQAFELLKQGLIPSSLVLTHTFSLNELEQAFAMFNKSGEEVIKPVILIH